MEKFFLAPLKIEGKYSFQKIEIGVIFKEKFNKLTLIDPTDVKLSEYFIKVRDSWTELSQDKLNYLKKIDKEKRIDINKNGIFEKIKLLKINEECLINKERYIVKNISGENYTFKDKSGREKKLKMTEIDSLENVEYFICIKSYGKINEGMIIVNEGGKKSVYPQGGEVSYIGENRLSKISRGEVMFMITVPLEERVEINKAKLWEQINKLEVNDQCLLKDDSDTPYTIRNIDVTTDGVKYDLRSKGGRKDKVDQSCIRPLVKDQLRDKFDEPYTAYDFSDRVSSRGGRKDNFEKKCLLPLDKVEKEQKCESSLLIKNDVFGLTIIDSKKVKKIESVKETKDIERMLVLKDTKHTAKLRWKGLMNDVICFGCEMDEVFNLGSDGRYNGEQLFKCDKDKGVIMPLKIEENYQSCEREQAPCHRELKKSEDKVVVEESICCMKGDIIKESDIVITEYMRGICKWRGEVNGEKCLGVEMKNSSKGYTSDGLIWKSKLFTFISLKGAIFAEKDICRSLHCDKNKVNFVNPTNIVSLKDGKTYNKMIILKQNNNSLVVRLRWKGKVDGRLCLGCELGEDCEYGTDGRFGGCGVFESKDMRGVMIEVEGGLECCEGDKSGETKHNTINTDYNKYIKAECICCVEGENKERREIILKESFTGTMKWKGRINGEKCVGVETDGDKEEGSNGTFKGVKIFDCGSKNGVLMKSEDITKTFTCDIKNMMVLNHTIITIMTPLTEMSLFVVLRDYNNVRLLGVKGEVNVDQRDCVGCVLPSPHKYGTNGTFGGNFLFKCDDNRGVLIDKKDSPNDCLKDVPKHKDIKSVNSYIKEDNICCIKNEEKSSEKIVKVKINNYKVFGRCLWSGVINGEKVLGIELDIPGECGTDGTFCGMRLYACRKEMGYLYLAKFTEEAERTVFIKNIYLKNNFDISEIERVREREGSLVYVEDDPRVYGRVMFSIRIMEESLEAIAINEEKYRDFIKDKVFSENIVGGKNVVIVRLKYVKLFKEDLRLIKESDVFIQKESVKVREKCESGEIKKGDIVRYESGGGRCYGRIERVELLNDVRCVSVVNTMIARVRDDNEERYIKEYRVTKVDDRLIYIQDPIIDPRSVMTFNEIKYEDLSVADEVEFKMAKTLKKFTGIIVMFVEVNEVPSAIVALTSVPPGENITPYIINEMKPFKDIKCLKKDSVIVVINTLQKPSKKIIFCESNIVFLLDPHSVKKHTGGTVEDKVITFKSEREIIVALLKWSGVIDGERILGCEMRKKSLLGTDGMFGDVRLFECEGGKGGLIILEKVEECCLKGKCKALGTTMNGGINGVNICCAQRKEKLRENSELKEGERVMRKNGRDNLIFGSCRWMGVANGEEVIGVEMVQGYKADKDEYMEKLALFDCPYDKMGLFLAKEFKHDPLGQCYCHNNRVFIVDGANIKSVKDEERLKKRMKCTINNESVFVDLRWRGVVNGVKCVGCEMTKESDRGTKGDFGGRRLFECTPGKGVLMVEETLKGSCVEGRHRDIIKYDTWNIDPASICCVEKLEKMTLWEKMRIGSKINHEDPGKKVLGIEYNKNKKTGECKWMGRVNGEEAVGVEMIKPIKNGTKGRFFVFDLFQCEEERGGIFLSEDIEHDIKGEEIKFVTDNVVDVTTIWKVKTGKSGLINGMKIGDSVSTNLIGEINMGELKWIGEFQDKTYLGIDLEEEFRYGMDGSINGERKFDCPPGHGVVTPLSNVKPNKDGLKATFNEDGVINADKYMKFEERWNDEYLKKRNIKKGGLLFIIINKDKGGWKRKGTLRRSGTINGEFVAVVELEKDYDYGTNGRFWREHLIKCRDKRAVAVSWENVYEYFHYQKITISKDKRKFEEIDVNSSVIYYIPVDGVLSTHYGTVKWSGMNDEDEYFYGIELDDRYKDGTDGTFKGERLFKCANGYGVLAPILHVAPDARFTEIVYTDDDVKKSEVCEAVQNSLPVKTVRGENFGIQGNANSCYFDSSIFALFSKSDVLDFMISRLINETEENNITKRFREILSSKIVYPLRKFGFVSFHHTKDMRATIKDYGGKFKEMEKHETDMENVGSLLEKLCQGKPLISLKTFTGYSNQSMFLQLFFILNKAREYISSQEMLEMSMAQNDIMFEKPPTCLIMQAPRDAKGINCYDFVLPSKTMEISHLCSSHFKKCLKCGSRAIFQCKKCIETSLRTKDGLFCKNHKCHHGEILKFSAENDESKMEVPMQLKAIICIEKAHFVTYVKEDDFKEEWVFFDSMSTQNITNNYAVPKVSFDKQSSHFLNLVEEGMKDEIKSYNDTSLKRIVKDSYIFIYHNTSLTCY